MDRQTDGWTDGQTERSDFIGHCPTNAECPKLRYGLILFKQVNDQRIMQSDWKWNLTSHTQPKVIISDGWDIQLATPNQKW